MKKAFTAIISGRVQGVCYRYYTQEKACKLNLCGSVCNKPDGTVEVRAEGEEDLLKKFLAWLNVGPPMANVMEINCVWREFTNKYKSFSITY